MMRTAENFERKSPAIAKALTSTVAAVALFTMMLTAHRLAVKKSAAAMSEVTRLPLASIVGLKMYREREITPPIGPKRRRDQK